MASADRDLSFDFTRESHAQAPRSRMNAGILKVAASIVETPRPVGDSYFVAADHSATANAATRGRRAISAWYAAVA